MRIGVELKKLRSSPAWNGRCWAQAFPAQVTITIVLRSSPVWNGRCWPRDMQHLVAQGAGCDPHRLGMAGAGLPFRLSGLPIPGLRSSPAWNGRCWPDHDLAAAHLQAVAILTGLEWPVLAGYGDTATLKLELRSSPAWNGRCWRRTAPGAWPNLRLRSSPAWNGRCWTLQHVSSGPANVLRSSPAWNGRCWRNRRNITRGKHNGCDPHRLGMAGAGPDRRGQHPAGTGRCDPHRLGMAGAGDDQAAYLESPGGCDPHRLGMAGAGRTYAGSPDQVGVAILTGLEWPVLVYPYDTLDYDHDVAILTGLEWPVLAPEPCLSCRGRQWLRSSPAWNGRCWQGTASAMNIRLGVGSGCDPHRLGMAGAGRRAWRSRGRLCHQLRSSPAWNGRCWPSTVAVTWVKAPQLRSSPAWNGRCWPAHGKGT